MKRTCLELNRYMDRDNAWIDLVTDTVFNTLAKTHELKCYRKNKDGKVVKFILTWPHLRRVVIDAWDASTLNPSWGNRKLCTLRHLSSQYGESRFDDTAIHINRDGHLDVGREQINECNWFSGWGANNWTFFCVEQGLDPKNISILFNGRVNTFYANYLNEGFIKYHQRTYDYQKGKDQRFFYSSILKTIDNEVPRALGSEGKKGGSNEKFFSFSKLTIFLLYRYGWLVPNLHTHSHRG